MASQQWEAEGRGGHSTVPRPHLEDGERKRSLRSEETDCKTFSKECRVACCWQINMVGVLGLRSHDDNVGTWLMLEQLQEIIWGQS